MGHVDLDWTEKKLATSYQVIMGLRAISPFTKKQQIVASSHHLPHKQYAS